MQDLTINGLALTLTDEWISREGETMREFSPGKGQQLSGRSTRDIVRGMKAVLFQLGGEDVTFRGEEVKNQQFLSALVRCVAQLPEDKRLGLMRLLIANLQAYMDEQPGEVTGQALATAMAEILDPRPTPASAPVAPVAPRTVGGHTAGRANKRVRDQSHARAGAGADRDHIWA